MTVSAHTRSVPAVTEPFAVGGLLDRLPEPVGGCAYLTGGDGLAGWGEYARFTGKGPDVAQRIGSWFAEVTEGLDIRSEVQVPGSGPVAFCSLGFDDDDTSVAIVPRVVLGSYDGIGFRTVIGAAEPLRGVVPVSGPGRISWADEAMSVPAFTAAVAKALALIDEGELVKVVLAHDLVAETENPVDERDLAAKLVAAYPSCATFMVDGLVGASPELLVRRTGLVISSRVLAGTAWSDHPQDHPDLDLLSSGKDKAEHLLAVTSAAESLRPLTAELSVPSEPFPLPLANLTHLATDLHGTLSSPAATALDVAAALHPTAAVGGTPTDLARRVIRDLEPSPRGRYAAPVGWLDTRGDGEFAIALRCAEISGRRVRLVAGCGIVAGSDPETEAREAQVKMIPVRDALES